MESSEAIELIKEKEKEFKALISTLSYSKLRPVYNKVLGITARNLARCFSDPNKSLEKSNLCASEVNERLHYFLMAYKENLVFYEESIQQCTSECKVSVNLEVKSLDSL